MSDDRNVDPCDGDTVRACVQLKGKCKIDKVGEDQTVESNQFLVAK